MEKQYHLESRYWKLFLTSEAYGVWQLSTAGGLGGDQLSGFSDSDGRVMMNLL
jgi:hypothetical protein